MSLGNGLQSYSVAIRTEGVLTAMKIVKQIIRYPGLCHWPLHGDTVYRSVYITTVAQISGFGSSVKIEVNQLNENS